MTRLQEKRMMQKIERIKSLSESELREEIKRAAENVLIAQYDYDKLRDWIDDLYGIDIPFDVNQHEMYMQSELDKAVEFMEKVLCVISECVNESLRFEFTKNYLRVYSDFNYRYMEVTL